MLAQFEEIRRTSTKTFSDLENMSERKFMDQNAKVRNAIEENMMKLEPKETVYSEKQSSHYDSTNEQCEQACHLKTKTRSRTIKRFK